MNLKSTPFLEIDTLEPKVIQRREKNGYVFLSSDYSLESHPDRITERLQFWATQKPDSVFLGQRDKVGQWKTISYKKAWEQVQTLAQYLLQLDVSSEKPIAILSGNSIEHGLLALAALHVGIPYAPISPAYASKSNDFKKLKHCIDLLTPGLIFVQDGGAFNNAMQAVGGNCIVVAVDNVLEGQESFESILETETTTSVQEAYQNVDANTYAKIMFSSGSTGLPKGVINTHGNITTNWQQITQTFQFLANDDFDIVLIDWLPWNHVYGGNHNFGIAMYNGGALYIDEGNPTPKGILSTINNLKEIAPTLYFNVPKGFEEIVVHLKKDKTLSSFFFSRLKMLFYAGASMPQHVWNDLEQLAYQTIGKRIQIASGMGMTEASPTCLLNARPGSTSDQLGVPVPGLEMKLVPIDGKFEARFKGGNMTPGYWRNAELNSNAYDDEGFYKSGDALKFADENDVNKGLLFDGRITEDFKLDTGTWVSVANLKAKLIKEGGGLIQDAVITGHNRAFLGAIVFPEINYCNKMIGATKDNTLSEIAQHPLIEARLLEILNSLAEKSTGGSTCIRRAVIANFTLLKDRGELTDKGSINQKTTLKHKSEIVEAMYKKDSSLHLIEIESKFHV